MSERLIAHQESRAKPLQTAISPVQPAFQSVIWQPNKNLPVCSSQPALSDESNASSAALAGKAAFKRSSRVLNESFSFGKKAARHGQSSRKKQSQKEKLQNSLAALVFSRQESQIFELSQDDADGFPPLSACRESFETAGQAEASPSSTAPSAQAEDLPLAQAQSRGPSLSGHLFVAGREVMLSDVLEESAPPKRPTGNSGAEMAKSYLENRLEALQNSNRRLQTQILDFKEENAALLRKLRQGDEESANLRTQLQDCADAVSKAQSLLVQHDQQEELRQQLQKQKEAFADQQQHLERALRENDDFKVAAFKTQTDFEKRNLQLRQIAKQLEEVSRQNLFLKEELDEMKTRYNLLSRKLVGQLKMSESQLRDIVAQSKYVQTGFVEDFYYRQKCQELQQQNAELQNTLLASISQQNMLKSKAISDCQRFEAALAQSEAFVGQTRAFLAGMLEQFKILFNFDNWSKTREEQFCFPSIQMLASTFRSFSECQAAAFWKVVDLNNVLDFVAFLSRSETQPAFARLIHSKYTFLQAWDQDLELALKNSVILRYEKYYELVEEDELAVRCNGLAAKQFLTDGADHPLTVWIMALFFFWMCDGAASLENGVLALRLSGFQVLAIGNIV